MNKSFFTLILSILILVHFLILHFWGISFFSTTLLFYYLIYLLLKKIIYHFKNNDLKNTILFNLKATLIICLIFEFSCTFILKFLNNPVENEKGFYLSPYMRNKQIQILYKFGILKSNRNTSQEGYESNYKHMHESVDFKYEVSYNKHGFRGEFPAIKKDSNEFRIICLGDSFVEGFGTSKDSTFPVLLEQYLKTGNQKVSVLNGGICGSNPLNGIILYHNKLREYNPDLVIMELNDGDLVDIQFNDKNGRMTLNEHFYAISHLFRVVYGILDRAFHSFHIDIFDPERPEGMSSQEALKLEPKEIPEEINTILDSLIDFKQQLQKENKQLVILYLPFQKEIFQSKNNLITEALLEQKIPFIDLREAYKERIKNNTDSLQMYYWKNDGHHTPKGYDLMGRTVAQKLIIEYYINKDYPDSIKK